MKKKRQEDQGNRQVLVLSPTLSADEHPDWTQDILLDTLGTVLQEKWEPQRKVQPFPASSPLPSGGWRWR